jgi:TatD DNase family protein
LRQALSGAIAAIGEIGLDFHPARLARTARATQEAWFDAQLQLAAEFERPVVIHSVKAHDRVAFYLKRYPSVRGVIHAFKGPPEQARVFVDKGWMLGCGSLIVRSSKTLAAFAAIPLEAIVLETDAPDMRWPDSTETPMNPLLDWWLTAERLAAARQMPVDELARITCDNAQRLFGWQA